MVSLPEAVPAEPVVDPRRPADPRIAELRREPNPLRRFLRILGPGLVTGASDDDPSGIGTYSQTGAQLGFGIGRCWSPTRSWPRSKKYRGGSAA